MMWATIQEFSAAVHILCGRREVRFHVARVLSSLDRG